MNPTIQYISAQGNAYLALLHFRNEWLRKPLGLSLFEESLSDEQNDTIITAMNGDELIGCVMLRKADEHTFKLRQMAVEEQYRGRGVGKLLMNEAERYLRTLRVSAIVLHARQHAVGFYESMGYLCFGEVFIEVTIPHIAMKKRLD